MSSSPFLRFMTDTGNSAGSQLMNINASVTPKLFYIQPPVGEIWVISHLHIVIACAASPAMGDYGSIAGGLATGIAAQAKTNGVTANPLGAFTFKKNYNWAMFGTPVVSNYSGPAQTFVVDVDIDTFTDAIGIRLDGTVGDYYGFLVQDNLTTLTDHVISVFGQRFPR